MVRSLLLCIITLAMAGAALAQTVTGSVTGQVTDSTGAKIVNATVIITNTDTNVETPAHVNGDGIYTAPFLPIGHYKVTASAPGFGEVTTDVFSLEINQTVKLNTTLMPGVTTQTVVVTGAAPLLNTTDATLGITISTNEIQNLPLEGRNFSSITLYQPGAVAVDPTGLTGANGFERNTYNNGIVTINGNRAQANNYVLDGIDLNEPQNNLIGYNPAPDAIAEVKVISANAPATYGNVNGGDVITVLKSGTNSFHGSAYGYLQNNNLDANSWSNKHNPVPAPTNPFTQAIFGGTVGGPILRNKLFFFGDYEGARYHTGGIGFASLLTPAMLNGDFSALYTLPTGSVQLYNAQAYDPATNSFPAYGGNMVPVNNPVAQFLVKNPQYYPKPNVAPTNNTLTDNNYQAPNKTYKVNNQFDVKLEWDPRVADKITGFYAQSRANDNGNGDILPISFPSFNFFPSTLFGATWYHTFSPAIVNEARAGFTRVNWSQGIPTDPFGVFGTNGNALVGIPYKNQRYDGFSAQDIGNFSSNDSTNISTFGNNGAPQLFIDDTFSYGDNLTIQHGAHLFSMGAQLIRYQQNFTESQNAGGNGYFSYSGIYTSNPDNGAPGYGPADFILNNVDTAALQNGGEFGNRQYRAAFFFQDDWKVTPTLTLNLGMRYEYDEPWVEVANRNANVLPLNGGTVEYAGSVPTDAPAGSIVCPTTACYNANYAQVMPRFGFAWQALPRFVVRGGYGATSFFEGNDANQRLVNNPPFVSVFNATSIHPSSTMSGTSRTIQEGFETSTSSLNDSSSAYSQWPQNQQPAYIHEYNLTTETALNNKTSLVVGYVGESGKHIEDYGNSNQFTQAGAYEYYVVQPPVLPAQYVAPYINLVGQTGTMLITESRAMMNYNGMQVTLRQRQDFGLEYTINYTWSRSMTNAAGNFGVSNVNQSLTFQDYFNSGADYGPAGTDIRNNLNGIMVYQIPYGHGRMFGATSNRVMDELLGGWSFANSVVAFSGVPVTIFANGGNTNSEGSERANFYRPLRITNRSIDNWFGTDPSATPCRTGGVFQGQDNGVCAYGQPGTYQFGTAQNGSQRAPGYWQVDTSLFKDFRIVGDQTLGFRADFFNIANVADYGNPDSNIQDTNFGLINSVRNQERRIQLALNYKF